MKKLQCFYINPSQATTEHGYVPSVVVAGEPGHSPLVGRGRCSEPWYWGKTLDEAEATCERLNKRDGVSAELASLIVLSSMFPTGAAWKEAVEMARVDGVL